MTLYMTLYIEQYQQMYYNWHMSADKLQYRNAKDVFKMVRERESSDNSSAVTSVHVCHNSFITKPRESFSEVFVHVKKND